MPRFTHERKMEIKKRQFEIDQALKEYNSLLEHEKMMKVPSFKDLPKSGSLSGAAETQATAEKKPIFNLKGSAAHVQFKSSH
jgi:hypothetical protein